MGYIYNCLSLSAGWEIATCVVRLHYTGISCGTRISAFKRCVTTREKLIPAAWFCCLWDLPSRGWRATPQGQVSVQDRPLSSAALDITLVEGKGSSRAESLLTGAVGQPRLTRLGTSPSESSTLGKQHPAPRAGSLGSAVGCSMPRGFGQKQPGLGRQQGAPSWAGGLEGTDPP